jgi:hypothetical protein
VYFNFDGTFAYLAGANEGTWAQVDDMIIGGSRDCLKKKTIQFIQEASVGILCLA